MNTTEVSASERAVIASLLNPAVQLGDVDRDAPTIRRLLEGAPESLTDLRLGIIAAVIHTRLKAGKGVTADLVGTELPPDQVALLIEVGRDGLPLGLAEREAETVLRAWQRRQDRARFSAEAERLGLRVVEAERPAASKLERELTAEVPGNGGADGKTFVRLAKMSPADFDRCREAEAERLGIRVGTLDAEVARRRPKGERGAEPQGRTLHLPDPEPWPESVSGADVLNEVTETFTRFVALPDGAADALALWTAHSHAFRSFLCSPRLHVTSPERGCGKTTLRDVLAVLVLRPLPTENLSVAVLFRAIEACQPTILADECDTFLRDNEELQGMLNAGHRRGGQALRCVGDDHEVRAFNVFAPAVLCGIGDLPGTLHDRSIVIRLERAKAGELGTRFDSRHVEREEELCRKIVRWAADNAAGLEASDPALPPGAFNRVADNWRSLFAVAEVAGGDWPHRAAAAFTKLTNRGDLDACGIGAMLLADIEGVFAAEGSDKLSSAKLASKLAEIEGRPWAEWGRARKPISTNQLAIQLRRFRVCSRAIRVADETPRGYLLSDFSEAFARYLPKPPLSGCNSATTLANINDSCVSGVRHPASVLHPQNGVLGNKDGACCTVSSQKPQARREEPVLVL